MMDFQVFFAFCFEQVLGHVGQNFAAAICNPLSSAGLALNTGLSSVCESLEGSRSPD